MKVYTIQLSQWRKAKALEIPFVNTTVKSGHKPFAPEWTMVIQHKNGEVTDEEYTERYLARMERSLVANPKHWDTLLSMPVVALSCYCGSDKFCHRHILTDFVERLCKERGIPFERGGEIV